MKIKKGSIQWSKEKESSLFEAKSLITGMWEI